MSAFAGSWKLAESENFDEYMKVLGVNVVTRKVGNSATPVQDVTVEGDTYTFKTSTTFKNTVLKFTVGVEFDEETMDGRKCKSVVTKESDTKLVHVQTPVKEGEAGGSIIREIVGDTYVMTLESKGVTSVRKYKKQ